MYHVSAQGVDERMIKCTLLLMWFCCPVLACWQNLCAELFLSRDDTEKVHDFEEECMEDFFREKENKFQSSSEERIRVINDR